MSRIQPVEIQTSVPGDNPIVLSSYYPDFADYYPLCELQTKSWMVEHIGTDWVCVDAGANIGYHSILMSRRAHNGRVYAFEPTSTVEMLRVNLTRNECANVVVSSQALGATVGNREEAIFRIWGKPAETARFEFTTLDAFVTGERLCRLDLIKIDVDGFDLEVLYGASNTLAKFSPLVIVEISQALATRGAHPTDLLQFMASRGYFEARVLDTENWLFRKVLSTAGEREPEVRVRFETSDPLEMDRARNFDQPLQDLSESLQSLGAMQFESRRFQSSDRAWAYMIRMDLPRYVSTQSAASLEVHTFSGTVGVFLTDETMTKQLSQEVFIREASIQTVTLPIESPDAVAVIVRKVTEQETSFALLNSKLLGRNSA